MFLLLMPLWMFSFFNLLFALHHLDLIHLPFMLHAHAISSYPLFGSDVRSVLRCIAARSLFRWFLKILGFFFFGLFFFFAMEKDALDIIIPSSAWKEPFFSPPFLFSSYFSYLYPSTIHLEAHGLFHLPSTSPFSFFFFTVTYLTYRLLFTLPSKDFLFFLYHFFNQISKKTRIFLFSFVLLFFLFFVFFQPFTGLDALTFITFEKKNS